MYLAKPKEGVVATRPNEKWHIDVSVLRLLDGTKVYLHAVIDNFSRKILAWSVADSSEPLGTCNVLRQAARHLHRDESVQLVCDGGIENFNTAVDEVVAKFDWHRIRALVRHTRSRSWAAGPRRAAAPDRANDGAQGRAHGGARLRAAPVDELGKRLASELGKSTWPYFGLNPVQKLDEKDEMDSEAGKSPEDVKRQNPAFARFPCAQRRNRTADTRIFNPCSHSGKVA